MPQDIFNPGDLTRDLAAQYANGHLSLDEYLTAWEDLIAVIVGDKDNLNTVAV